MTRIPALALLTAFLFLLPAAAENAGSATGEPKAFNDDCALYCDKLISCDVIPEWVYDECLESCRYEPIELVECVIEAECEGIEWCFDDFWIGQCIEFAEGFFNDCPELDLFGLDEDGMVDECVADPEFWECLIFCRQETDSCAGWLYCASVDCDLDEGEGDDDGPGEDDDDDDDLVTDDDQESLPEDHTGGWRCG